LFLFRCFIRCYEKYQLVWSHTSFEKTVQMRHCLLEWKQTLAYDVIVIVKLTNPELFVRNPFFYILLTLKYVQYFRYCAAKPTQQACLSCLLNKPTDHSLFFPPIISDLSHFSTTKIHLWITHHLWLVDKLRHLEYNLIVR